MIAVDANLLVYAHVTSYPQHDGARQWLEEQVAGSVRVGLPWASLLAFVRLVTNPRLFTELESVADAWEQVDAWLDADPVWLPASIPTPPRGAARLHPPARSACQRRARRASRGTGRRTRTQARDQRPRLRAKYSRQSSKDRTPPVLDSESIEHMGLAVVRRLAGKHGIRVRLGKRAPHGTTTSVLVPSDVVCEAPPAPVRRQAVPGFATTGGTTRLSGRAVTRSRPPPRRPPTPPNRP